MRCWLFLILMCAGYWVAAQEENRFSNLRSKLLSSDLPRHRLDSLTVAPPLLAVSDASNGQAISTDCYTFQHPFFTLDTALMRQQHPNTRLLRVEYRVLPYDLNVAIRRLDTASIRRRIYQDAIEFDYTPYEPAKKPWETAGVQSSGAYTRGLSFGNSQNLVFNSNLNLQLAGKLGSDLELSAAISDNSIPIQPDGTTRQLKEFDRIFIQVRKKNHTLSAGDYDLTKPPGYFSQYFKRLQGAMTESYWHQPRDTFRLRAAAAVSRGKFARQLIQGQEGNQGPYRLQGAEGERFIIVLAGTERVYIDGQLMRRGIEDDYVMDYNLGELTFTPRRLITKDIRIIIEFEYAVQTYLRSTATLNAGWNTSKGKVYFNFYSEQDSRNNGGAQELSPAQRSSLALSGDDLRNAFATGIDTLPAFDPGRVLYQLNDTVVCGQPIAILQYSTDPENARYSARFTEVGQGQGHYRLAQTAANGRVFQWSAPDPVTCQPTGNFEPIVKLIAPEMRQLWAAGAELKPSSNSALTAEISVSNRDYNRFSPLGDADNAGIAAYLQWKQNLNNRPSAVWRGDLFANLEAVGQSYQSLNPYRPAEFIRDWNTDTGRDTVSEQIGRAGGQVQFKDWARFRYEFAAFRRSSAYLGLRQVGSFFFRRKGWELTAEANVLQSDGLLEHTRFQRPKADFSKTFYKRGDPQALFKTGLYFEQEKNRRTGVSDTLSKTSFWYDLMRWYIQTPETGKSWRLGGFLSRRNDYAPDGRFFNRSTQADEFNLNGQWSRTAAKGIGNQSLAWVFSYRNLAIKSTALSPLMPQKTYLGKLDYNLSALRGGLTLSTNYELGAGQSPKLEFNYLKVNPGEGQYTWIDRNRDSILQVDEMELAVFADQAAYVRVAVTTTEYIPTNQVLFNPSLRLEPQRWFLKPKHDWQKVLRMLAVQSNLQFSRRTVAGATSVQTWNPFQGRSLNDSVLVTLATGWRNTLFVNRGHPKWDASYSLGDNRSRLAVTTGFEARSARDQTLHGRLNLSLRWSLEADLIEALKISDNQAFNNRDYQIRWYEAGPRLNWLPSRSFRLSGALKWRDSRNGIGEKEYARQNNWSIECTWNPELKANLQGFKPSTSLRLKATLADIRYQGAANTAVAFAMLDGLQNGRNIIWSVILDRQLSKTVQLALNYEGRKTGENRMVHVGRAQVRALF